MQFVRLTFITRSIATLTFAALALLVSGVSNAEVSPAPSPLPPKLAVMLDYNRISLPVEVLVDSLSGRTQRPDAAILAKQFQNPVAARLLIDSARLTDEIRQKLDATNPDEILHRYMVLEYKDLPTAAAAKKVLQLDPSIAFVKQSELADFMTIPNDPFYTYAASSNRDYQWGMNDAMLLQPAWTKVRGTAYLAVLDNGIQSSNPGLLLGVHEDLTQAFRRFKFNVDGGTDVDEHPELTQADGSVAQNGAAGHGTHVAGIMAGSTSQLPSSVASGYPNPSPSIGISGACWYCNLMIAKISRREAVTNRVTIDIVADVPAAIYWAVNAGAQAINMSLGGRDPNCTANPYDNYCAALNSAAAKGVVIVAAAGNSDYYNDPLPGGIHVGDALGTILDFPASNSHTIAVGATQQYVGGAVGREYIWTEEAPSTGFYGSSTGPSMTERGIVAPGRAILSTFYTGRNWNVKGRCGIMTSFEGVPLVNSLPTQYGPGTNRGPSYGICTGTSMATPHITGIVGLMRTVNPLLDALQIRSSLLSTGYNAATPNSIRGHGIAHANGAVDAVLATTNRLTPLFSSYSALSENHFYTVVPQMARAALTGGLIPQVVSNTQYVPYGSVVNIYTQFPDPFLVAYVTPRAEVWLFTTHNNPMVPSVELMPLYRLSWKCGDGGASVCASKPNHVSHFYTTNLLEAQTYINTRYYAFDGIEGYVYPTSQAKPTGTSYLMRAYNGARDDYALFPETQQATMASQGYSANVTYLGYIYVNTGNRPSY